MDTNEIPSPSEPKKYIRTLAGDMAILKKGGTPELTPFIKPETSQSPSERLVEASPLPPIPTPSLQPSPKGAVDAVKATEGAAKPEKPSPIETYESDFSEKMRETNASPATVLAAEQDAGRQTQQPEQKSRIGLLYLCAGAILLVISGVGVYFAYTYYISAPTPNIFAPLISSPIFVDENEQISGTGAVLLQAIKQSINRPLASGAIRILYTATATTTDNSVFSALQEPAPSILLRNIIAKDSMAGIVSAKGGQSPFFILSVSSYSNTFYGMLTWERTMPRDLAALFPPFVESFGGQASSTIATSSVPTTAAGFRDETVSNHDVRIYRDAVGQSVLLYGYWNQTTLVIARDPTAFTEILSRLANSRTQ